MELLNILAGPTVGAVIGYFTNYLAVKMLFRPLKEIKICGHTLPFTPGIIPRRKNSLAEALGNAVGNNLFTTDDIKEMLMSESVEDNILKGVVLSIDSYLDNSINEIIMQVSGNSNIDEKKDKIDELISSKIIESFENIQLDKVIADAGGPAVKKQFAGSMAAMFINDKLIETIVSPISDAIKEYVKEHEKDLILPEVSKNTENLLNQKLDKSLTTLDIDMDVITQLISSMYEEVITDKLGTIINDFDISKTVTEKIKQMDVIELEKLILSVMKKELNAIVNLGALIGFIIGIINCFF